MNSHVVEDFGPEPCDPEATWRIRVRKIREGTMSRASAAGLVGVVAWLLATVYPLESDAATEAEL